MKTARDQLDILTTYQELGSYRATAALCGTTHKTVRRVVERRAGPATERPARPQEHRPVRELIAAKVESHRRPHQRQAPAAALPGRGIHRLGAAACAGPWPRPRPTIDGIAARIGPGSPSPASTSSSTGALRRACRSSVPCWPGAAGASCGFAQRQDQATTLALLAECFEQLGGVPGVALTDRMGCLKGGVVAGVMVPAPDYVAFAAHYGFRPDFCEAGDPESKGVVEHLVGYAKTDLLVGLGPFDDLGEANTAAVSWCAEVNGRVHSETVAVPDERLAVERTLLGSLPRLRPAIGPVEARTVDKLRTVRFRSARYSVPGSVIGERVELRVEGPELVIAHRGPEIARHRLVGPGELSLDDAHYGGPARKPARALRPGPPPSWPSSRSVRWPRPSCGPRPRAGTTKLPTELALIVELERSHGREALVAALERALAHRRFRAADIRAILAAGAGVSRPRAAGAPLEGLPAVPVRPLAAYALGEPS